MSTRNSSLTDRLRTTVGPRLPATPGTVAVLLGDLLVLVVLFSIGLSHHGADPVANPLYTLETVTPFATAWLVLAPTVGLYLRDTLDSYRRTFLTLVAGWSGIVLLGGLIRSTAYFRGSAAITFLLVQIGLGLLLLLPWRVAVTAYRRRGRSEAS